MPKHRPIYFKSPTFPQEFKTTLEAFIKRHPVATSTVKALLAVAILGGALTVAAAAPGMVNLVGRNVYRYRREQRKRYNRLWARFHALRNRDIFEYKGESADGGLIYQFTDKGTIMAKKFVLDTLKIDIPKKWDHKWRIIVFDIPEKYKKARYALYIKLKDLGCYPMQKSVWVHPFPCGAEINFLKDIFNIHLFVEVFTTSDLPNGKVVYYFQDLLKDYF